MVTVSTEQPCMLHNTAAGNNKNWCLLQTAGQLTGSAAHTACTESSVRGEIASSDLQYNSLCVLGYYCSVLSRFPLIMFCSTSLQSP